MQGFAHAPATRGNRVVALALSGTLLATSVMLLAIARGRFAPSVAFLSMYLALACGLSVLTTFLLYVQARVTRSMPLAFLAAGYMYSAAAIVVHALTFPGLFGVDSLLHVGAQTSAAMGLAWHGGFPLFIAAYALAVPREQQLRGRADERTLATVVFGPIVAATVIAAITVPAAGIVPELVRRGGEYTTAFRVLVSLVLVCEIVSLAVLVRMTKLVASLDLWLAVALVAEISAGILAAGTSARFAVGWYGSRIDDFIGACVIVVVFVGAFDRMIRRLAEFSSKDGLTGLINRRVFDERLEEHVALAARSQSPLSLLMIDVDYFKQYNDFYGHPAGDGVLVKVAACIDRIVKRKTDFAARFGGEEFVIVLPHTDADGAKLLAGRINMVVADSNIEHEASPLGKVTISIGCETSTIGAVADSAQKLVARADEALYAAKEKGRNRVEAAEPRISLPVVAMAV